MPKLGGKPLTGIFTDAVISKYQINIYLTILIYMYVISMRL